MKDRSSSRRSLVVRDALTPEEQRRRLEDLLLKRCKEVKRARLERAGAARAAKKVLAKQREKSHFTKRCRPCPALKVYLKKNGGKKS